MEVLAEADDGTVETLRATPGHLFWVEGRGWTEAGELSAGDVLASADGQAATVGIVRPLAATATVYNLEVAEFHTYHVGSRASWVHNGCGPKVKSRIQESTKLIREAESTGRSAQRSIDGLTAELARGNLNLGIGTKPIGFRSAGQRWGSGLLSANE